MKFTNQILDAVYIERTRQVHDKGYTSDHDDKLRNGELAHAASAYAFPEFANVLWPGSFERGTLKLSPDDRQKEILKAMALLCAEYERLEREKEQVKRVNQC